MASIPRTDLFSVAPAEDPAREWGSLVQELEKCDLSLLEVWKSTYEQWKHGYQRFRECEERAFFTASADGEPRDPDDNVLRLHRRAILALLGSGEKCEGNLNQLPLGDDEKKERLEWARRLRVLLDSLRESFDLWHPMN